MLRSKAERLTTGPHRLRPPHNDGSVDEAIIE